MKQLQFEIGGRPLSNDDLQLDQNEQYKILNGIFKGSNPTGRGAFIITGCDVSGADISSGICFIDGKNREFSGATSVTYPYYIFADTETTEVVKQYKDGANRATQIWANAIGSQTQPVSGEFITMSSSGGRTWIGAQDDQLVTVAGTQTITGIKTFSNDVIMTGNLTLAGQNVNTRLNSLESTKANKTTTISAGTGLTGGGSLSANRTIAIATAGVDTTQLRDASVTTAKIADNAITAAKIADNAVGSTEIANNSITTSHIVDGTIISADIGNKTITNANIADLTIGVNQLAANSVTNIKLADNAVDTAELVDNSVTWNKLNTSARFTMQIKLAGEVLSDASVSTAVNSVGFFDPVKTSVGVYNIQHTIGGIDFLVLATATTVGQTAVVDRGFRFNNLFRILLRDLNDNLVDGSFNFVAFATT